MQVEAVLARARQALEQGRPAEALAEVEQALAHRPGDENLRFWQALLLQQNGRHEAAVERLAELLRPNSPPDWLRAGLQLVLGRGTGEGLQVAADWGRWLCEGRSAQAIDWYMHGCVLARLHAHTPAERALRQALALQPGLTQAHHELALCLHRQQRAVEALEHFAACGPLEAGQPWFHYNHALSLQAAGRPAAAIRALEQALQLQEDFLDARLRLAELLAREARWAELKTQREIIQRQMEAGVLAGNTSPYTADVARLPAAVQRRLARAWSEAVGRPPPLCRQVEPVRGQRPLRVGLFGGDLNLSAVGSLLDAVLPQVERERLELFGLSTHATGDAMQARIRQACCHWLDLDGLTDLQAAERIHALELDVLLDVSGYTRRGRPGVLAFRPAPRQLALWGYLNAHCAEFIDAILADAHLAGGLPQDWNEPLLLHPQSLLPPRLSAALCSAPVPERTELGLPQTARVLASFNAVYKLHPELLRAWARILRQDGDAVLWLGGAGSEAAWGRVLEFLQAEGVAPARLIRASALPLEAHLARLRLADLWLDSFPYNGGAGVVAAHSVGLPVLALDGTGLLGRMSASLNRAMGQQALVADRVEDYIRRACHTHAPAQAGEADLRAWTDGWIQALYDYCVS